MSRNAVSYGTREHREPVLAARLDERGRHALEDDALAEPEPAGAGGGELAHEVALGAESSRSRTPVVSITHSGSRKRVGASTSTTCAPATWAARGGLLAAQQPQP